jgi:hypothetical protein
LRVRSKSCELACFWLLTEMWFTFALGELTVFCSLFLFFLPYLFGFCFPYPLVCIRMTVSVSLEGIVDAEIVLRSYAFRNWF